MTTREAVATASQGTGTSRPSLRRAVASRVGTAAAAACLLVTLAAGTTQAATNNAGKVFAGWGSCRDTYIQVTLPIISPAAVQYGGTPLFGSPVQRVAWRANLDQLIGGRWVQIRTGTWWTGPVGSSSDYGLTYNSWTTLNGQPMPSVIGFDSLPMGTSRAPAYFKVWYDVYWYADSYRDAGSAWAWAGGHQENRGAASGSANLDQTAYAWCKYPGPNWLL